MYQIKKMRAEHVIDFTAKLEMNGYMIEFDTPYFYYDCYYGHRWNEKNLVPESVTPEQVKQWKRMCEVEIAKRGLQFHDILMVIVMAISLAACGKSGDKDKEKPENPVESIEREDEDKETETTEQQEEEDVEEEDVELPFVPM